MSVTTSSSMPRRAEAPAVSASAQPYLYRPSWSICSSWSAAAGLLGAGHAASSPGGSWGWFAVGGGPLAGAARSPGTGRAGAVLFPGRSGPRDVRGADPVTVGDGGQALDVGAHEPADHRSLGLAQLRELRRDVRHRAVVLAQLPAAGDRRGRRSVTLGGERDGQGLGPVDRLCTAAATAARGRWRRGSRGRPAGPRPRHGRRRVRRRPRRSAARSARGRRRRAGRTSGRRR